ncbi:hypothetical protein [Streptomyces cadmiisoli]|uniref:hypothetical protein n=1 Tax=Streptomyces cadmiisoli TaxID=2184053 RepID=UPI003650C35A
MADTGERQECVGRGDGTRCPYGATLDPDIGPPEYRCDDCRHHYELDCTEPWRRADQDDVLTRPTGDPGESGTGTAA